MLYYHCCKYRYLLSMLDTACPGLRSACWFPCDPPDPGATTGSQWEGQELKHVSKNEPVVIHVVSISLALAAAHRHVN